MIQVVDVSFGYPGQSKDLLTDISFCVSKGEWLSVVGQNGSGKSTLIRMLNGLILPNHGQVIIDNLRVEPNNLWEIRKKIGMVFQNPDHQFVGTTVFDDMAFSMENFQIPREEMLLRIDESLEALQISDLKYRSPEELSGGQKQRVALAGIWALRPDILVLDEATSMLDAVSRIDFFLQLQRLRAEREITVVSVTHDLSELEISDRTLILAEGKCVGCFSSLSVLRNVILREKYALGSTFLDVFCRALRKEGIVVRSSYASLSELVEDVCQLFVKM